MSHARSDGAMAKRAQTMQQQIEQERAIQTELQQVKEHLRRQESETIL
jgi:hypothetical protein